MVELEEKFYQNILLMHDPDIGNIMKSLDIVKKYILREKLIIVGGMSIDFALRLRGKKLYEDGTVPDYDVITPTHWINAYDLTQWLNRIGMTDLSAINAFHPTTIRIRIKNTAIADITYIPKSVYNNIMTLNYHGFNFIHPYYQFIDQHRSLAMGYENLDSGRPNMKNRLKKDMERFDLLWEFYPVKYTQKPPVLKYHTFQIDMNVLSNQCLTGFLALQYWLEYLKKYNFKPKYNIGESDLNKGSIQLIKEQYISFYSNDIKNIYEKIATSEKSHFFEPYLDKIPRKIITKYWEIFDNTNIWIAGHKIKIQENDIYIGNLQTLMLYFLLHFVIYNKDETSYPYYCGYMICIDILKFAIEKKIEIFFPTSEYYGDKNLTESFILAKNKFNKKIDPNIHIPAQPNSVHDKDLKYRKVPTKFYDFKPEKSELFQIGGNEIGNFLESQ